MATGAKLDIDAPAPEARDRATLLSVAKPIPVETLTRSNANRLVGGVTWLPWPDIIVTRDEADCDTDYDKQARNLPGLAEQTSFLMWDRLRCSTLGLNLSTLADMTAAGLTEFVSAQYALELESASNTAGLDLSGNASTIVAGSAVSIRKAFARLENYLAVTAAKPGMRGVIHLTPGLLVLAEADSLIAFRDGKYQTATGTCVVGDAGHTGQVTPTGESAAGADEAWIYATGDVWYGQSELSGVTDASDPDGGPVYVARNQNEPLVERYGIIVFDPNTVAAALVDVA